MDPHSESGVASSARQRPVAPVEGRLMLQVRLVAAPLVGGSADLF